jgi:hypothetical protein
VGTFHSFFFDFIAVFCEMKFAGGDWALHRRVPEGRKWFQAKYDFHAF